MGGVTVRFTGRRGGVSTGPYDSLNLARHVGDDPAAVTANRRRAVAGPAVWMDQVHGDRVEIVAEPQDDAVAETDALVTTTAGLTLAVMVADCVPVVLHDAGRGVAAVAHAGRRGVEAGIAARTVDVMESLGAHRGAIAVQLGPAICGACYEVPAAMQAAVAAVVPDVGSTTRQGTAGLDLRRGLAAQLRTAGVTDVTTSPVCTAESDDHYSYRRDGVTGRFAGLVVLG